MIYIGTSLANTSLNDSVVYIATFKQEKNDDSFAITQADFPKKEEPNNSSSSDSYSADNSSSESSSFGSPRDYTQQLIDLYNRRSTLLAQIEEDRNQHEMSIGKENYNIFCKNISSLFDVIHFLSD